MGSLELGQQGVDHPIITYKEMDLNNLVHSNNWELHLLESTCSLNLIQNVTKLDFAITQDAV